MGWHERVTVLILISLCVISALVGWQCRIDDWNTKRARRRLIERLENRP